MNKPELIAAIAAQRPRLTKAVIQSVVDGMVAAAEEAIVSGKDFAIPGIVRLSLVERSARIGRNPATGEPVEIGARRRVKAKVAGPLAKVAN